MKMYRISEPEYYNLQDLKTLFDKNINNAIETYGEKTVKEVSWLSKRANDVGAYVTPNMLSKIRKYKNMMLDIRLARVRASTT